SSRLRVKRDEAAARAGEEAGSRNAPRERTHGRSVASGLTRRVIGEFPKILDAPRRLHLPPAPLALGRDGGPSPRYVPWNQAWLRPPWKCACPGSPPRRSRRHHVFSRKSGLGL